ncbi:MAG TPA: aldo/keto reductase [Solirubrobacteraceae bacterium]|jgi:aryl-alcohol dehydrogenase-like predicted oxidoreductase
MPVTARLAIETRPLGRSSVAIPRVALGCGNFGGVGSSPAFFGAGVDEEQAFAIMDAAWELGINHFDTADAYGGGRSETMIGNWMRARGHQPLLTTKTFNPMAEGADSGLAPERLRRQLHSSLERLGVDHVDLYLTHEHDPDVAPAEVVATLEELRAEGLIRASGVSNYDSAQLRETLAAGHVDAIQNNHSLLIREDERSGLLAMCASEQVTYTVYSPLAGGWLTGKYRRGERFPDGSRMTQRPEGYASFRSDAVFDALETLAAIGAARGMSMAAVALSWLLSSDQIGAIVVGPMRPDHLDPVREALESPLGAEDRQAVGELFE